MTRTLEQLDAAVTELETIVDVDGSGGPESLQPNVLSLNPDGTIGANLTGHLRAAGVDLSEKSTPLPEAVIRWLDALGVEQEAIFGQAVVGFGGHSLVARAGGPGGYAPAIVNADGSSSFVQFHTPRKVIVNAGGDTVHFAASQHAQKTVLHGLTKTPAITLATANGSGAANCLMQYLSRDATFITFDAFDPTAVRTGDSNFDWLAIAFD